MAKQSLDELIEQSEEAIKKGGDLSEIEAEHHHKVKDQPKDKKEKIAEKIKEAKFESPVAKEPKGATAMDGKKASEVQPSEAEGEVGVKKPKPKKAKQGKEKIRSKKYQAAYALIDQKKKYEILESLELVKKTSYTSFDGNTEVHIRLLGKLGKPEQARGLIKYPHSTGKKTTIVILDEKIINEIIKSNKINADIYIATPEIMPLVAKLAKILGPKGKMPNPKAGTITNDPEKTKKDLESGQIEYKTDSYGIIHQIIGKVSGKSEELSDNLKTLLDVLPSDKIVSINLCATMGPGIKVQK